MSLPKTGNPTTFKDLKTISILPTLPKIFERIIVRQLRDFLIKVNVLSMYQSGFHPSYSYATALLNTTNNIFKSTDNNFATMLVTIDYRKAFDSRNYA